MFMISRQKMTAGNKGLDAAVVVYGCLIPTNFNPVLFFVQSAVYNF